MKKKIKTSDVKTLCFYDGRNGKRIWVGECEAGYLYGAVGFARSHAMFCRHLDVCFRFAMYDKDSVVGLSVERGSAIPVGISLDWAINQASFSLKKGLIKDSSLSFSL